MLKTNDWLFLVALLGAVLFCGSMMDQRDQAKADMHVMIGMYNGLLFGRGCELPK